MTPRHLLALLVVLLVLTACGRGTMPAAPEDTAAPGTLYADLTPTDTDMPATDTPPSATITSTATTPQATDVAVAQAGESFTSPRFGYTIVLPCCWVALPAPATAVEAALADLSDGTGDPLYDNLIDELRGDESRLALEYIAYLPDEIGLPEAQLTVSVMPAEGLTPASYIDGVTAEIGGIGTTSVVTGHIEPDFGPGRTPVGLIEYTTVYEADPLHGLQIAFFPKADDDGADDQAVGDHLIVLTFTTNADKFAALRPEFMDIVRSVTVPN